MAEVACSRCGETRAGLTKAPLAGADGALLLASVCTDCWHEWTEEEVRTINELRLNFIDPEAQKTLRDRMLSYLNLAGVEQAEPLCDRGAGADTD